ncbi:spore coat protein U domain-containing protein [Paracoccus seriniphilus]|uniref:spore coat protein U domain-containing protein n=1 Tax=Paracoccus seriniphilus TaxID=184748 RepID=UPI0035667743
MAEAALYPSLSLTGTVGRSEGAAYTSAGSGSVQSFTVHGRVPAQTTPPPGDYFDTVVVTITY